MTEAPRSGGLYGTVLVLAVVIALTKSGHAEAEIVLGGVLITTLVFYVVHVYADVLAARVTSPDRSWTSLAREIGHEEIAIVEAAILPCLPLLLGTLGVLDREAASWGAIGCGLVSLFGWGLLVGRALGYDGVRSLLFGAANVALGGLMVLLKVLVH
ncbi:hypothetical protein [Baekduia sp. Peel2402]|uniref:hypothetical protein n=1 Tax=Baekduia sp. Peel2402 TaxID=3458296 RepID=UPI00403E82DB